MNRHISVSLRNTWGIINYVFLRTGLYKKEKLPVFDFDYLQNKWTYTKPQCLIDDHQSYFGYKFDLSICIPMYNVENYIKRLLMQIDTQKTRFTYEVILVNDGSTDATGTIVKEFIEGRSNYKLFSQENMGISAARNKAIEEATGNYLAFIDSDDEICEGFIENLMSAAITYDADIIRGKYALKQDNTLINRGVSSGYIWGCVIRKTLFNRIRFPEGYWYEDMINPFLIEPLAKKTICINDTVIYHNDVKRSASKQQSHSKNYKALEHLYLVISLTEDYKILGLSEQYLHKRLIAECSSLMFERTGLLDEETKKQVFLACNWIFESNRIDPAIFSGLEHLCARAIIKKDYTAWKLAARVQQTRVLTRLI